MYHVSFLLVLFLYQLSVGCMLTLALLPLKQVDRKFYQLTSGLSALLLAIGAGLALYYPFELPEFFAVAQVEESLVYRLAWISLFAYFAVLMFLYVRMRLKKLAAAKLLVRVSAFFGVALLTFEGLVYRPKYLYGGFKSALLPLDFVTAALFLGVFMVAMVFGHWYLVQAMPKKLLRRMAEILILILVIRIAFVVGTLWTYSAQVPGGELIISNLMDISHGHGMFFWQRVLIGLGIPLVLSYMIWSTAKMGANQSATGLLYVGVVFVIIGEIVSKYMFVMSGIPI